MCLREQLQKESEADRGSGGEKKKGEDRQEEKEEEGEEERGGGCLLKTAGARSSEKCQVKLFLTVLISAPHSHNYM